MHSHYISGTLLAAGLAGLVAASVSDINERLIYNEVVIYVLGVGIALRLLSAPDLLWLSLLGSAFLLIVLGQVARFGVIGGGDAKLIAAVMPLLPPQQDAQLMANIAVAGGILSCVYLAARTFLRSRALVPIRRANGYPARKIQTILGGELARTAAGEPMPYALAILAGVICSISTEALQCISATSCSL